jgi:hypothetical protein
VTDTAAVPESADVPVVTVALLATTVALVSPAGTPTEVDEPRARELICTDSARALLLRSTVASPATTDALAVPGRALTATTGEFEVPVAKTSPDSPVSPAFTVASLATTEADTSSSI